MKYPGHLFLLLLLLSGLRVDAQVTGQWLSAEAEFDLPKKFTFETSYEARTFNTGGLHLQKHFIQTGLNYKINKHFDLSLKYRFVWRLEENMHYYYRDKIILDIKFDYPLKRFHFDYRARSQRVTKTYIDSEFDRIPAMHFRNKFEFSYDVRKNPIEPALYFELFSPLNKYRQGAIDQIRTGVDVKYPMAKRHRISGGLMYMYKRFDPRLSGLIFRLAYKININ